MEKLVIDKMYAFIADNPEGEGVIGMHTPMGWVPFVGADIARVESLRAHAEDIANKTGKEIKLVFFSERTEIEVIKPGD